MLDRVISYTGLWIELKIVIPWSYTGLWIELKIVILCSYTGLWIELKIVRPGYILYWIMDRVKDCYTVLLYWIMDRVKDC